MNKEKKKALRRKLGLMLLNLCGGVGYLPLRMIYFMGYCFGMFAFFVVSRQRKVAIESLGVAFPELAFSERKKIARQYFVFILQSFFEIFYFIKRGQSLDNISIEGKEHLIDALKYNKGAIGITAHLGNFPLMCYTLSKEGYRVSIVVRPLRDGLSGGYLEALRVKCGANFIYSYPRRKCVNSILKELRNNGIIIILMDQNFGTGGVWVKFFGKLAATPAGPFVFARRTGAAIVPLYIVRYGMGKHRIKLFSQVPADTAESKEEGILFDAGKCTGIIESWIRKTPSQWAWIHRRWKSRPSGRVKAERFRIQGQMREF